MNAREHIWWWVNDTLSNGLVPSYNKPLPEQCWSSFMMSNGVTRSQWVNVYKYFYDNITLKYTTECSDIFLLLIRWGFCAKTAREVCVTTYLCWYFGSYRRRYKDSNYLSLSIWIWLKFLISGIESSWLPERTLLPILCITPMKKIKCL